MFQSMNKSMKWLPIVCLVAVFTVGCGDAKKDADTKTKDTKTAKTDEGHEGHNHAGGHEHGPHGGELFDLSDFGVRGEYKANYGQNFVTLYTFDKEGDVSSAKEVPVKADKMVGSLKVGDEEKTFVFEAANAKDGMASRFVAEGEDVCNALANVGMTLNVEIDGKKMTTKLHKDPHGH